MGFMKSFVFGFLTITFLLLIYISLVKKDILNIIVGFIFLIVLVVLAFWKFRDVKKPIPKHIIIEKYKELMEDKYSVSLSSNTILFRDEETPEEYVMVLKDIDEDNNNMSRYFPFECNKFELIFGRGTGSIKYKISETLNWLHQNTRINLRPEIYVDLSERAKLRTLKEMDKEDTYAGGEVGE